MKKKLSFLLAIVMVLSLTTTALATEVPISSIESMRTYLTEVGVEEEFINTVSDEMITSLYDEMSSGRAEVESYSVAYGNIGGAGGKRSDVAGWSYSCCGYDFALPDHESKFRGWENRKVSCMGEL